MMCSGSQYRAVTDLELKAWSPSLAVFLAISLALYLLWKIGVRTGFYTFHVKHMNDFSHVLKSPLGKKKQKNTTFFHLF